MACQGLTLEGHKGGHAEIDHQDQGGESREETYSDHSGAEHLGENAEYQRPAMTDIQEIKEGIFQAAEMGYFSEAVVEQELQSKDQPDDQNSKVKTAFRILRGEESIHGRWGFMLSYSKETIFKEMLIDALIHTCLERSLAKGKIIRIFSALEIAGGGQ